MWFIRLCLEKDFFLVFLRRKSTLDGKVSKAWFSHLKGSPEVGCLSLGEEKNQYASFGTFFLGVVDCWRSDRTCSVFFWGRWVVYNSAVAVFFPR